MKNRKDTPALDTILDLHQLNMDHKWADLKRREEEFEASIDREKLRKQLNLRNRGDQAK